MKRLSFLLTMFLVLLIGCGGGGSSGGTGSSSSVGLYFTDDASIYPSIIVKVYEVNLCSDNQCQQKVNIFTSSAGLEIDLANLNGVLQYITTANIPQGTYNRLEVVLDKNLTITDNQNQTHSAVFTPMSEKPNKPNTVQCSNDRCYIRFNGIVQPFAMNKLVVDFVLKEFEVNTSTNPWQVTEVKMKPLTPQELSSKHYDYEIYGTVQNVNTQANSFTVKWMGNTYTINIVANTVCEINDVYIPFSNCINHITSGMCLEIKVLEDPISSTTLTAIKIENEDPGKCMGSGSGSSSGSVYELKGSVTGKDSSQKTFTLNNSVTIKITDTTYCEYQEHVYKVGTPCFDELQVGWFVEVKTDGTNAIKIEREYH